MSAKETGGFAFPTGDVYDAEGQVILPAENGMTLRDWFAGMALAGLQGAMTEAALKGKDFGNANDYLADGVYQIADSMLEARSK